MSVPLQPDGEPDSDELLVVIVRHHCLGMIGRKGSACQISHRQSARASGSVSVEVLSRHWMRCAQRELESSIFLADFTDPRSRSNQYEPFQ